VRLAVLLSGRGSNFEALAAACARGELPARIVLVLSDRANAAGLEKARALSLRVQLEERRAGEPRIAHEERLAGHLEEAGADLVCLAGFMRVLSPDFVARFERRILNVHPSLLPAFPGLEAQKQALEYGVTLAGATVHLVDAGTDTGPIAGQETVAVFPGDTVGTLAARILSVEHRLYPATLVRLLAGGWAVAGRRLLFPS
jgi:phosphoribosylglycinamide formyltransferase-1